MSLVLWVALGETLNLFMLQLSKKLDNNKYYLVHCCYKEG